MKTLITGATGFIGSNLLNLLVSKGIRVFCVVRHPSRLSDLSLPTHLAQVITGDLGSAPTFAKFPTSVDIVIHLAAVLGAWNKNEQSIMKTNVEITKCLLDWFSMSDSKQFIFLSTPGVQGFGHRLARESDPYNPGTIYERSKVIAEEIIQNHDFRSGQNWTIIRPDFVYGPQDVRRIKLYKRIMKRRWIKIGKGSSVLRPTFVLDLCRAVFMCMGNPNAYSQVFNVAGPELITSDKYAEIIAQVLGVKLPPLRLPAFVIMMGAIAVEWIARMTNTHPLVTKSQVDFLTIDHGTDISKIRDLIGFTPITDFRSGMGETLAWMKGRGYI